MNVSARDFVHPEDQAALDNLKSIPLLSSCVQAFMKLAPERVMHGRNMAQKIRLGPRQLPEIYKYLPVACAALNIAEPEFYLEMDPVPNAYTYGDQMPAVTVTSGLLECLAEDEMQAVVAHECGHIACQHTLYHTMATLLIEHGSAIFGPLALLSTPIQLALLYWMRRSELSADRAAAVVMRGSKSVIDVMIRLAGGPRSITGKIDIELYIQQADAYDKLLESQWDQLLQGLAARDDTHPLLSIRTREIIKWCAGEHFQRLVQNLSEEEAAPKCPGCRRRVHDTWKFCNYCGYKDPHGSVSASEEASRG